MNTLRSFSSPLFSSLQTRLVERIAWRLFGATRQAALAMVVLTLPAVQAKPASDPNGDVVIKWNQVLTDTLRVPGLHPPTVRTERSYSMLHVAMFDAANAVERRYTSFRFDAPATGGASAVAATAQAAHDLLSTLYPTRKDIYDEALATTLADLPAGPSRRGARVGSLIAAQVLAWRSTDQWNATPPAYLPPDLPGYWQPTPPAFGAATLTHFPGVVPFAVESNTRFLAPPPPFINTAQYTAAFDEVKRMGAKNSLERTPDQTLVARLHASVGTRANPQTVWNGIVRDVSRSQNLDLLDTARLFALVNVAFHDALQTSFTGKYSYHLWRPVTAIRRADEDLNPATDVDPAWEPLLSSPPYPTYPGNAAALSAASARMLARFFGTDAIPFDVFFEATDPNVSGSGWTRSYAGFWECANEQALSRIWGGIHFSFDSVASQNSSVALADWVFESYMVPVK